MQHTDPRSPVQPTLRCCPAQNESFDEYLARLKAESYQREDTDTSPSNTGDNHDYFNRGGSGHNRSYGRGDVGPRPTPRRLQEDSHLQRPGESFDEWLARLEEEAHLKEVEEEEGEEAAAAAVAAELAGHDGQDYGTPLASHDHGRAGDHGQHSPTATRWRELGSPLHDHDSHRHDDYHKSPTGEGRRQRAASSEGVEMPHYQRSSSASEVHERRKQRDHRQHRLGRDGPQEEEKVEKQAEKKADLGDSQSSSPGRSLLQRTESVRVVMAEAEKVTALI